MNTIGIRREDLSKVGEQRVAIAPAQAVSIVESGSRLLIQPGVHPETDEPKRAFDDAEYVDTGGEVTEDLSGAEIIFGLKEVDIAELLSDKLYLFFSHTHKGQVKNRPLLKAMMEARISLVDYELIYDTERGRVLTAFGRFAGLAGMVDSLWVFGQRLRAEDVPNPFEAVDQSIRYASVADAWETLADVGRRIVHEGTPVNLPPMIVCVLGRGRTSAGAREMLDVLPVEEVSIDDLSAIYESGGRDRVFKLVLEVDEMYRIRSEYPEQRDRFAGMSTSERFNFYVNNPAYFESNMDRVLPYVSVLVNCIIWSNAYPRTVSNELIRQIWRAGTPLRVIGDVTCDPNGSIEFSLETWIDDPVFTYDPLSQNFVDGLNVDGINVMAVTNLPCEFSRDASIAFSRQVAQLHPSLSKARLEGSLEESGLSEPLRNATILWHGELTPQYAYLSEFVE